ncbi:nitrous oxide reductase accessory protein NosL [Halegenticoccus tardaugens]|uniref:nitrous oxide reductase accessory protein NosL n=1 Tax=Halegenticoccus tardaugens TaxID=2071624 RepID=UPI00100A8816|nr:nitrous oxide reductase accessory protein NosL [Halegenticoccus tardaugens]
MADVGSTRRRLLVGIAGVGVAGAAGCLAGDEREGRDDAPADSIDLDGRECDACGMVIGEAYGVAGQLFYADGKPEDPPARFDSVVELVTYHEERRDRGWELREAFVADCSRVDYDLETREGERYVTTHAADDAFADATELRYVVDSGVRGAMGPAFVPFSDGDDAAAFADEHGGEVVGWDELPDAARSASR